jgi:hypothetical protein
LVNTANEILEGRKLRSIPELAKEECYSQRDVSSSEKPKVNPKLVNDTILEEREGTGGGDDISMSDEADPREREMRQGIMSKLSKKMARDFTEQVKKKSLSSHQSGGTAREEYLDRTVYKITKGRSPIKHTQDDSQHQQNQANPINLSVQFATFDNSMANISLPLAAASFEEAVKAPPVSPPQTRQRNREQPTVPNRVDKENKKPSHKNKQYPLTRSQMRSASSQYSSRESSSSSSESSQDHTFAFMQSKLSREEDLRRRKKPVAQPLGQTR